MKPTPKFSAKEYMNQTLRKDWFELQLKFFNLGKSLHSYMTNFIQKRSKNPTGNLSDSITYFQDPNTKGRIHWSIGDLKVLSKKAPYWAIQNFGGNVNVPEIRPKRASVLRFKTKDGQEVFAKKTRPRSHIIKPMNYTQATAKKLNKDIKNILKKIRR